jgi:alkylated DNA nucleotide flippase Atl1
MADAAHTAEVHRLVDLLPEGQVKALYVLLRSMLPGQGEEPRSSDAVPLDEWAPDPDAPVVRTLSAAGIARGDHDLAERSADILRRELGHPDA